MKYIKNLKLLNYKINLTKKHWIHFVKTNCYAYALGLDIREDKIKRHAYQPGVMSNYKHFIHFNSLFTYEHLINAIYADMDALGIEIKLIKYDDKISDDSWKVALFITRYSKESNYLDDYHFLRYKNNAWYHKNGYDSFPSNKDDNYNIIINPKECYLKRREYKGCYCLKIKR